MSEIGFEFQEIWEKNTFFSIKTYDRVVSVNMQHL